LPGAQRALLLIAVAVVFRNGGCPAKINRRIREVSDSLNKPAGGSILERGRKKERVALLRHGQALS